MGLFWLRSEKGYFIYPTVYDKVDPQMTIFREEVFGPVLTVSKPARTQIGDPSNGNMAFRIISTDYYVQGRC